MAIIMIARHWQGDYVQAAHVKIGKQVGLSHAGDRCAPRRWRSEADRPARAAVHRFAAALIAGRKLPDAEFASVEKALGRNGVAEVLVLLGYYTSVAMAMKVHEVPIPPALARRA